MLKFTDSIAGYLFTSELDRRYRVLPSVCRCDHVVLNDHSVYRCEHVVPSDRSVYQYERVALDEHPNVPNDDDVVPNGVHSDARGDGGVDNVQLHS